MLTYLTCWVMKQALFGHRVFCFFFWSGFPTGGLEVEESYVSVAVVGTPCLFLEQGVFPARQEAGPRDVIPLQVWRRHGPAGVATETQS